MDSLQTAIKNSIVFSNAQKNFLIAHLADFSQEQHEQLKKFLFKEQNELQKSDLEYHQQKKKFLADAASSFTQGIKAAKRLILKASEKKSKDLEQAESILKQIDDN